MIRWRHHFILSPLSSYLNCVQENLLFDVDLVWVLTFLTIFLWSHPPATALSSSQHTNITLLDKYLTTVSYFQQVVKGVDLIVDIIVRQHLLSLHQLQSLLDCYLVNAKTKTASAIKLLKLIFNIFYLKSLHFTSISFSFSMLRLASFLRTVLTSRLLSGLLTSWLTALSGRLTDLVLLLIVKHNFYQH